MGRTKINARPVRMRQRNAAGRRSAVSGAAITR